MADVYPIGGAEAEGFIEVLEDMSTGHVDLTLHMNDGPHTITVDGGDLARALMTASPSFAKGLGEIAQRAILTVLNRENDDAE